MTSHFSSWQKRQAALKIGDIEASSYESKRDGCRVTLVKCEECARMYEEELEGAKAKVVSGLPLLCLSCDAEAQSPAFKGLTIQLGWFAD